MAERMHKKASETRSRLAVLAGAKKREKGYKNPERIREVMQESFMRDAIKLAIAEDVMAKPQLYGEDVAAEYRRWVSEYLGEEVEL